MALQLEVGKFYENEDSTVIARVIKRNEPSAGCNNEFEAEVWSLRERRIRSLYFNASGNWSPPNDSPYDLVRECAANQRNDGELSKTVERLITLGQQMSNAYYNFVQNPSSAKEYFEGEMSKNLLKEWDSAKANLNRERISLRQKTFSLLNS